MNTRHQDTWQGFGIAAGTAAFFLACAQLGIDPGQIFRRITAAGLLAVTLGAAIAFVSIIAAVLIAPPRR